MFDGLVLAVLTLIQMFKEAKGSQATLLPIQKLGQNEYLSGKKVQQGKNTNLGSFQNMILPL